MTCVQSPVWLSTSSPKPETPAFSRLHEEIKEFAEFISCTREEVSLRNQIISKLTEIVKSNWLSAQVVPYGSCATKLSLTFSDLDFVILGVAASQQPLQPLFDLASGLNKSGLFDKIDVITTAKIPLIKTVHTKSGIACDICFGVQTGLQSTQLTNDFLEKLPELRPLILVLKYFLHQRGLNIAYTGGLSSYQTLLLLINHIQLNEDPVSSSERDLGHTFINFLEFYGVQFDYEKFGIRIGDLEKRTGAYFEKSERNWFNFKFPRALCIEDPHNPDYDIGRTVFAIDSIRQLFQQSFILLTSAIQSGTPNALNTIIPIDPNIIKFRKYIRSLVIESPSCPSPSKDSYRSQANKKRHRERSSKRYWKNSIAKKDQESNPQQS